MRNLLVVALIVFAVALAIGVSTPSTSEAGNCYYTCSCTGTPLFCCVSNGVTTCKLAKGFYCPQIVTC